MDRFLGYLFWIILLAGALTPPIWLFYHGFWIMGTISTLGSGIPILLIVLLMNCVPDFRR